MSATEIQVSRCITRGRGRGRGSSVSQVALSQEAKEERQRAQLEILRAKYDVPRSMFNSTNLSVMSSENGIAEGNKEKEELREFIIEPARDKKKNEQFYIANQMLALSAIPHTSNEVLEEADVQLYTENFFGVNEDSVPVPNIIKPELPTKIVRCEDGRYYLLANPDTKGLVHLPQDVELNTRLLFIDEEDVLYMRCYDEDLPQDKKVIGTIQKLQSCMESYYSRLVNQLQTYMGKDGWIPEINEVIVVKVKRLASRDHERCGFITTIEYHRAVVRELVKEGLTVELIDDYGIGGVGFSDVFMILPKFTALPPQMFHCELEEMGLVSQRYLIRTIVRDCPINGIWPDCLLNYVGTTWRGNRTAAGRPLVEVNIQLKDSIGPDSFVTLKGHIYQNLQCALNPFVHMVEGGECKVLDCNEQGFLWVRFDADKDLAARMRFTLDKLWDTYISLISCSNLTVEQICPEDADRKRHDKNMSKIYVTVLPDPGDKLFRVKIKSANPRTQRVRVYSIDDHLESEVNARTMLPLHCLYPDLAQIAPLVSKVHLHCLKSLQIDHPEVRKFIYGELELKLVHEWPRSVFPPEVSIKMVDETPLLEEEEEARAALPAVGPYEEKAVLTGYCKVFVEKKLAAALNNVEMEMLEKKLLTKAAALKEKEELERDKSYESTEDKMKKKALEKLGSQTFMGENYMFLWEGFHVKSGRSVKSGSSDVSTIIGELHQ